MFAEEQSSEGGTDAAPAIEPARMPPRRPAAEDVPPSSPSPASPAQPAPASPPVAGSRPTPPIEAIIPAENAEPLEAATAQEPVTTPAPTPAPPVTPWMAVRSSSAAAPVEARDGETDDQAATRSPAGVPSPTPTPWMATPSSSGTTPAATPMQAQDATREDATDPTMPRASAPPAVAPAVTQPVETPPLVTASRFDVFEYEEHVVAVPPAAAAADAGPRAALGWPALRLIPVPLNPYVLLLSGLASLVMLAYLLVEPSPRGFLILGAAVVAAGLDGTLRATWRVTYAGRETTAALFMPAIFILAVPPLIEHNVRGLAVVPAGLAAGLAFFAIVAAQVGSARPGASYYPWARTVSTAGAYAAGFAFFSLTYVYNLGIVVAGLATGLVALMLAIEVLREGEIDAIETAGYAAAAGAAVGQWRLALHYLPVDGYLAGLAVLLGFLLVTGLLQAYITRSLDRRATIDHAAVAFAGAVLVVGARVAGLA